MILNSFLHLPSVGRKKESELWAKGVLDWEKFLLVEQKSPTYDKFAKGIQDSILALKNRDHRYFSESLPTAEHWRLFREFADNTAYIDIETTGLSPDFSEITTIALYDGKEIKTWSKSMGFLRFRNEIAKYDLLVTFNGKGFDIPFIEKYFDIELRQSHIDLRYVLASLGYSGGLKACERALGLSREELEGVDGSMAVHLWYEHQKGKRSALDTLLAYNIEDTVNLEHLMHFAYNQKVISLNFSNFILPIPKRREIPFEVDIKLIERLKKKYFSNVI